jgi:3-oxoacyl-[acyl-carrier-protein] synthase II
MERVVITGCGLVTPLGIGATTNWQSLTVGKSGIRKIAIEEPYFDKIRSKIAGRVWDYNPDDHFSGKDQKCFDLYTQYAIIAAREALVAANIDCDTTMLNKDRCGVTIGSGIGGLGTIEREAKKLHLQGANRISPFFIPASLINMASGFISLETGFRGPNLSQVSACASGAHSIIFAAQQIQMGLCDVMLCGGAEHGSVALGAGGFSAMRALSTNNDNPEQASRPWDKDRDGFVIADGAGVLVLESLTSAQARGTPILAELVGYGMNADASHMVQPDTSGEGAKKCMLNALQMSKLTPSKIAYINAHATSTPVGDQIEPIAIRKVFDDHADKLAVSSTKSMHGHMLGAAGAAEAIITIMALQHQLVPPTINCDQPSPGCDLDFVREGARALAFDYAMSNSFGFGGTNASLVLARAGAIV